MIDALAFLTYRTFRNRLARQIARLKSPRYAVAMAVGIVYLWLAFLRPGGRASPSPTGAPGVPAAGSAVAIFLSLSLGTAFVIWWLRGGTRGALAFQPAEVQMLFSAPLTRRTLIAYRIARSQVLLLLNAALWTMISQRWGLPLSGPERFLTAWSLFSVLTLHRLGAALVQTPPLSGARRAALWTAKSAAVAIVAVFATGMLPALRQVGTLTLPDLLRSVAAAFTSPPASYAVAPFRFLVAPLAAHTTAAWVVAFAGVVAVIALHVVWVLSMNVPFEETAAVASEELAKRMAAFRARRDGRAAVLGRTRVKRDWLPLAPTGPRFVAIVWKNTLALSRTSGIKTLLILAVAAVAFTAYTGSLVAGRAGRDGAFIARMPVLVILAMSVVLGSRLLRNDLRSDLPSLGLLKTYPLGGTQMMLAELASPALALTLFQVAVLGVTAFTLPSDLWVQLGSGWAVAGAVLLPLLLCAINAVNVTIQNGAVLLYPSWAPLGAETGGVEAMGQNLLFTIGSMLLLIVTLLLPALWGGMAFGVTRLFLGNGAYVVAVCAVIAALVAEVGFMVVRLGRRFEQLEPSGLL